MMPEPVLPAYSVCFEHDRVVCADSGLASNNGVVSVPKSCFDWLLAQSETQPWLRLEVFKRTPVLKMQQYVGVLRSPCGHVLEILPKTGKAGQTVPQARHMLLKMLAHLPSMKALQLDAAAVAQAHVPLLEVLIGLALQCFAQLMQRGLCSQYVSQQSNQLVLRGKLLVSQQIRYNHSHHERFYTEHDVYQRNRPENRLLRAALGRLLQWTRLRQHQQLAHALDQRVLDIAPSVQIAADFKAVRLDRNMQHYRPALAWCELILGTARPLTGMGQAEALSLLFDMNRLFEQVVEHALRQQMPTSHQLKVQASHAHVLQHPQDDTMARALKPDLLYGIDGQACYVLDAKWKLLDRVDIGQVDKDDLHQMAMYAAAYLPQGGAVCLVYPQTQGFDQSLCAWHFAHVSAGQVTLWLVPFCTERLVLIDPPLALQRQPMASK
jgi:5-methylcytosine-specific restriction enzyme subunit McrC